VTLNPTKYDTINPQKSKTIYIIAHRNKPYKATMMIGYRNRHSLWIKTIAMAVVCLFLVNIISWAASYTLSPPAGDPETYQEMLSEMMQQRLEDHQGPIDEFIRIGAENAEKQSTGQKLDRELKDCEALEGLSELEEEYVKFIEHCSATEMQRELESTLHKNDGKLQVRFVDDESELPTFKGEKVWGHAGKFITAFALRGEMETKIGRRKIIARFAHEIRARSTRAEEILEKAFKEKAPADPREAIERAEKLREDFERANKYMESQIIRYGKISSPDIVTEFQNLKFADHPSVWNRDYTIGINDDDLSVNEKWNGSAGEIADNLLDSPDGSAKLAGAIEALLEDAVKLRDFIKLMIAEFSQAPAADSRLTQKFLFQEVQRLIRTYGGYKNANIILKLIATSNYLFAKLKSKNGYLSMRDIQRFVKGLDLNTVPIQMKKICISMKKLTLERIGHYLVMLEVQGYIDIFDPEELMDVRKPGLISLAETGRPYSFSLTKEGRKKIKSTQQGKCKGISIKIDPRIEQGITDKERIEFLLNTISKSKLADIFSVTDCITKVKAASDAWIYYDIPFSPMALHEGVLMDLLELGHKGFLEYWDPTRLPPKFPESAVEIYRFQLTEKGKKKAEKNRPKRAKGSIANGIRDLHRFDFSNVESMQEALGKIEERVNRLNAAIGQGPIMEMPDNLIETVRNELGGHWVADKHYDASSNGIKEHLGKRGTNYITRIAREARMPFEMIVAVRKFAEKDNTVALIELLGKITKRVNDRLLSRDITVAILSSIADRVESLPSPVKAEVGELIRKTIESLPMEEAPGLGLTIRELAEIRKRSPRAIGREMAALEGMNFVSKTGKGTRGDPYRYRLHPMLRGLIEDEIDFICENTEIELKGAREKILDKHTIDSKSSHTVQTEIIKIVQYMINDENRDLEPDIEDGKVLWHVFVNESIPDDKNTPWGIRQSFITRVNNRFQNSDAPERIKILFKQDNLQGEIKKLKDDPKNIVHVIVNNEDRLKEVPKGINVAILKGTLGNYAHVHGAMAVSRALAIKNVKDRNRRLRDLYKMLTGDPFRGALPERGTPQDLARAIIFTLPAITVDSNVLKTLNDNLIFLIRHA
jgi:hypothetical protein